MENPVYVEVVTSPECSHSPDAIRAVRRVARKRRNVVLLEVSMATEEGQERAKEFDVKATPTIAVNGKVAYVGVPTLETLEKLVREETENERERTSYFF